MSATRYTQATPGPNVIKRAMAQVNHYRFQLRGLEHGTAMFTVRGGEEEYDLLAEQNESGDFHAVGCTCKYSQIHRVPCKHAVCFDTWAGVFAPDLNELNELPLKA